MFLLGLPAAVQKQRVLTALFRLLVHNDFPAGRARVSGGKVSFYPAADSPNRNTRPPLKGSPHICQHLERIRLLSYK